MKNNGKQRLFEVMSKLDSSFKPKMNEQDEDAPLDQESPWEDDRAEFDRNYDVEPENDDDSEEEGEDIEHYPIHKALPEMIREVEKTKNDLREYQMSNSAGGIVEEYYRKVGIALNEFYKNTFTPLEQDYDAKMQKWHYNNPVESTSDAGRENFYKNG